MTILTFILLYSAIAIGVLYLFYITNKVNKGYPALWAILLAAFTPIFNVLSIFILATVAILDFFDNTKELDNEAAEVFLTKLFKRKDK